MKYFNLYYLDMKLNNRPLTEEELEEVDRKVNMLIAPIIPDDEDDSSC